MAGLLEELDRLGVAPAWRHRIAGVAPDVVALGVTGRVRAIYINRTETPSESYSVSDWAVADLTRHHRGAWPLALDLFEEGLVSADQVRAVQARLLELGQTAGDLDAAASEGVAGASWDKRPSCVSSRADDARPALRPAPLDCTWPQRRHRRLTGAAALRRVDASIASVANGRVLARPTFHLRLRQAICQGG